VNHAVVAFLIVSAARPWPSLLLDKPVIGSTGLIRLDVADARDFLDQQYGTAIAGAGTATAMRCIGRGAAEQDSILPENSRSKQGRYLTSFSAAEEFRRSPCGDVACDLSAGPWSGIIASHNTFNSESATRLSFIRSWRIAKETNSAVSRLALTRRAVRHSSRAARTECNRCSELATSVFSVTALAR
jgi:hypothetical protein